jgi:hypothetical protein
MLWPALHEGHHARAPFAAITAATAAAARLATCMYDCIICNQPLVISQRPAVECSVDLTCCKLGEVKWYLSAALYLPVPTGRPAGTYCTRDARRPCIYLQIVPAALLAYKRGSKGGFIHASRIACFNPPSLQPLYIHACLNFLFHIYAPERVAGGFSHTCWAQYG